jgi:glycosyl transferase family 25
MRINQLVDAVYVLSVRSFDDRIAHMEREMARHGIKFEFVFEFDANAIPDETIGRVFAPSDMKLTHQSLVLKHIETWRLCVARNHQRVLVFEDDAVLSRGFAEGLARAVAETDLIAGPWMVYLGRGDNRYVGAGRGASALVPGGVLPATDALVFNREAAQRRLAWIEANRIVRPADWLMREMDAAIGVPHYWLREPLVEQGSMSGMFESVLDEKRESRSRLRVMLRYQWDKWWKRLRLHLRQGLSR